MQIGALLVPSSQRSGTLAADLDSPTQQQQEAEQPLETDHRRTPETTVKINNSRVSNHHLQHHNHNTTGDNTPKETKQLKGVSGGPHRTGASGGESSENQQKEPQV